MRSAIFSCLVALVLAAVPSSASAESAASLADIPARDESGPAVDLEVAYIADIWRNEGGVRDGWRYLDNLDLAVEADLQRLAGWDGATAFVQVLYNNGASLSELTGDALVVSNIEAGTKAVRLYQAWIEQDLGGRASLRAGLYDLNSEFDALDASALFIGSAHGIGMDIAQSGENGPSIFPFTGLAARLEVEIDEGLLLRVAAVDGVPGDLDRPKHTVIDLGDGALLIGEADWRRGDARLLAGAWRYTTQFTRFNEASSGRSEGAYLRGEFCLDASDECGAAVFARAGIASGDVNPFATFLGAGVTYRPADEWELGLAIAHARTSSQFRAQVPGAGSETALEATAAFSPSAWLTIQPNVQYVVNPGGEGAYRDAIAIGLRTVLAL